MKIKKILDIANNDIEEIKEIIDLIEEKKELLLKYNIKLEFTSID